MEGSQGRRMKTQVDPKTTKRARAFQMWMTSPMPMVTLFKTFDVSRLLRYCKRNGYKFNMALCWCLCKAASGVEEFYLLPEKGKMFKYDRLAVNVVVDTVDGGIFLCDVPYSEDIAKFNEDYLELTGKVHRECADSLLGEDYAIVGTSTLLDTELDGIINQYSGRWNNPFIAWGRYRKKGWFKTELKISMQFHHSQMDGADAAKYLELLQKTISM